MLVSIIIPAYNSEKYIARCVNSCTKSKDDEFGNIEIIIVDDGSTDNTSSISDNMARGNRQIKVIHKKNGGLSDARNKGIIEAKGEYLLFLDSDDTINYDELESILNSYAKNEYDAILFCGKRIISEEGRNKIVGVYKKNTNQINIETNGKCVLQDELNHDDFSAMAQMGLYRRSFILENNLLFKSGIIHEDEEWNPRMLLAAKRVIVVLNEVYNYFSIEGSITHNPNPKRYRDLIDTVKTLRIEYDKEEENIRRNGNHYLCKLYLKAVSNLYVLGEKVIIDWRFVIQNINSLKDIGKIAIFSISKRLYKQIVE